MSKEEIKTIIDSVLTKLQQSDTMLDSYFEKEKVIDQNVLRRTVKQSIGELESLSDGLKP